MLDAVLTTARGDSGVALALTVTNGGEEPVTLRFRTGQRADFAAYEAAEAGDVDPDGAGDALDLDVDADTEADPVWRHGEGRLFTQALGSETLDAGASATYEGTWNDPPSGAFLVVGSLTAEAHDASAAAEVTVD